MIEGQRSTRDRQSVGLPVQMWDSFAERPFAANVAGVVLDAAGLPEDVMRAVAGALGGAHDGVCGRLGDRLPARLLGPILHPRQGDRRVKSGDVVYDG